MPKECCRLPDLGEACQASEHPQVACRVQDDLSGQVALAIDKESSQVAKPLCTIRPQHFKAILSSWRHTECSHIWTSVEGLKVPTTQNTKNLWSSKDFPYPAALFCHPIISHQTWPFLHCWGIGPIHGHRPTSQRPGQKDLYHSRVTN